MKSVNKHVKSIARHLIGTLENALKVADEDSVRGLVACGNIYESAGLLQPAMECYEAAAHSDAPVALARLALCQLKAGHAEEGLRTALRLVSVERRFKVEFLATSEYCSAMSLLGDALLMSGREASAVAAYRSALEADRSEAYAAGRLVSLLLAQGETEEAVRLGQLIGDNPRFTRVRELLRLATAEGAALPREGVEQARRLASLGMPGRPLLVGGSARVAESASGPHWRASLPLSTEGMLAVERESAGAAWEEAGRSKHASVAAFARSILQLMSLGAPDELVVESSRALQDELEHARLALGVASVFLERPVSVGALDLSGLLADRAPALILRNLLLEGCLGESVAALQAADASVCAEAPVLRQLLSRIAQDEARHAELAWRSAAWVLSEYPELVETARETFAEVELPGIPAADQNERVALSRYGQLSGLEKWEVACRAWRDVIRPRAEALLSTRKPMCSRAVEVQFLVEASP